MTKFLLYAAALVAFSATPAVLWADTISMAQQGRCPKTPCIFPDKIDKCKAHPASCR